jgi:hypothetical protein
MEAKKPLQMQHVTREEWEKERGRQSALMLYEKLTQVRHAAMSIYDRQLVAGKKPEEIQDTIEPLQRTFVRLIENAVKDDLPGCIMAVNQFETTAQGHDKDASILLAKADQDREHAFKIREAIVNEMKASGITEKRVGAFNLVIAKNQEGVEVLVLR